MLQRHFWTVLVKKSHTDRESNSLLLGEVIEEVLFQLPLQAKDRFEKDKQEKGAVGLPLEHEVISYLVADKPNTEDDLRMEVQTPEGKVILAGVAKVKFGPNSRARNIFRGAAFPISGSGMHTVRVLKISNNSVLAEVPVFVTLKFV